MYVCLWTLFFPVVFFDLNTDNELGIFRNSTLHDVDFYDLEVNFTDSLAVGKAGIGLSTMSTALFYMLANLVIGKYWHNYHTYILYIRALFFLMTITWTWLAFLELKVIAPWNIIIFCWKKNSNIRNRT